jgi:formate-dependent nitrite reductase membrane component NrfD
MTDYRVAKGEAHEDQVTAALEKFTAQVPSSAYLALALASMAVSLGFSAAKKSHSALFVGQWAAPFLLIGIYNKLVKLHGSDGTKAINSLSE